MTEHELRREIAYWRDLLARVADDMVDTGGRDVDPKRKRWFESRSSRIKGLLDYPVPSSWSQMTSMLRRR